MLPMIFGIIRNTTAGTWHPMLFRMAPLPSSDLKPGTAERHRSFGHHTEGFTTREEAQVYITEQCAAHGHSDSGRLYEWDGTDIPATTDWFVAIQAAA